MIVVCLLPIRRMIMRPRRIRATASAIRIAIVAHSVIDVAGVVVVGRVAAPGVIVASVTVFCYCCHR